MIHPGAQWTHVETGASYSSLRAGICPNPENVFHFAGDGKSKFRKGSFGQ